jgi:hypothetical protein
MDEKKYKDKLFGNSGNFTKEMISYRIKDTLMNLKDKHGAVSFRPRLEDIDDKIMNESADNSEDLGDAEWLEHQRKMFFKNDPKVTTAEKMKKFDNPNLTEFKGILSNSNLISDIQTCMINSFASTKVVTRRIADRRNAEPLRINSFIKSFIVKAQHEAEKEKDPTAGSRTSVLNKLCKPTSKQCPIKFSECMKIRGDEIRDIKEERDKMFSASQSHTSFPRRLMIKGPNMRGGISVRDVTSEKDIEHTRRTTLEKSGTGLR